MQSRFSRFPTFMLALGAITLSLGGIAVAQPSGAHKAHKKERRAERLKQFDLNADGQLSDAERSAMWKHRFALADAFNSTGIVAKANKAPPEKTIIPNQASSVNLSSIPRKMSIQPRYEPIFTAGIRAALNLKGAYPSLSCIA